VPIGLGRFAATIAAVMTVTIIVIAAGLFESLTGRPLVTTTSSRFAAVLEGLRQCLDFRWTGTLGGWLGQVFLFAAAVAALVVRHVRSLRLDGRRGRHMAWGWLAVLFLATSCANALPIGSVYAGCMSELIGVSLGAGGCGWWILTAACVYTIVVLWAVLPLYERTGTAAWLTLSLAAWAAAGGCAWVEEGIPHRSAVGQAAWIAGAAAAAIAMLTAVRSVVREVRGLARCPAAAAGRGRTGRAEPVPAGRPQPPLMPPGGADGRRYSAADAAAEQASPTEYIDGDSGEEGDEADGRPLSKAERKRLRKLARMGRAA
jgi:hypothetical protein